MASLTQGLILGADVQGQMFRDRGRGALSDTYLVARYFALQHSTCNCVVRFV